MQIESLEKYIKEYIKELKRTKELKHTHKFFYVFRQSKKSRTIYISFYLVTINKTYRKTVRISDHYFCTPEDNRYQGTIIDNNDFIQKKELKRIKKIIKREIKKLIYCAHVNTVYNFKAEGY